MIIKRWNGSAFVKEFPQTKAQLIRNNADSADIFDANDKIKPAFLPDSVFDSLIFVGTISAGLSAGLFVDSLYTHLSLATSMGGSIQTAKGYYWVISTAGTINQQTTSVAGTSNTTVYAQWTWDTSDNGTTGQTSSGALEVGDWFVIESISGAGTSGSPWIISFSVINNAYELATTSVDGIVRLSSRSTYAALSGNSAVTEGVLKTVIDNAGFAAGSHSHGNITNGGLIGTTANLPIITGSGGILQAGSFGTSANTFTEGNDARLSDARTPTSHTHGNITNAGAIGTTANLPIITTTSGVLIAGSFGTTANTFTQGNDSRLSDARTPTTHTHGNISNDGALGQTASAISSGDNIVVTAATGSVIQKSNIQFNSSGSGFLKQDGSWATPTNTTYNAATASVLGLIELFSDTQQTVAANAVSATASRTYGIQLNANNQAVVNVPWTDNNTTYSAGEGITLSSTTFRMTNPLYVQTATPTTSVTGTIWYDIN